MLQTQWGSVNVTDTGGWLLYLYGGIGGRSNHRTHIIPTLSYRRQLSTSPCPCASPVFGGTIIVKGWHPIDRHHRHGSGIYLTIFL